MKSVVNMFDILRWPLLRIHLGVGVTIIAGLSSAHAQQPLALPFLPPPIGQGVEVLVTPYLWLPWTAVRVTPSNRRIPGASDTIDPGKLVSHLTWVPFMGAVEFRSEPYSLMLDYLHAPLKSGVATHNILFNGAQTGFDD